jgi:hypothetical protein
VRSLQRAGPRRRRRSCGAPRWWPRSARSPGPRRASIRSRPATRTKLEEYRASGARLGWLIDPVERRIHIYRPGAEVETLDAPATVTGDPVLREFALDLRRIW